MPLEKAVQDKYTQRLSEVIQEGSIEAGVALAKQAFSEGVSVVEFFTEIIQPVLTDLGDAFSRLEIFLPELMKASMVVKGIQENVFTEDNLKSEISSMVKGKVVIGTCQGDIHDIGKSMVAMLLQINGFTVKDLGVNVSPQHFIEEAQKMNADIIAMSSLLTTSLPFIKDVVNHLNAFNNRDKFKVIVGGAAVNSNWAASAGLDGYGRDAVEAVEICTRIINSK